MYKKIMFKAWNNCTWFGRQYDFYAMKVLQSSRKEQNSRREKPSSDVIKFSQLMFSSIQQQIKEKKKRLI